MGRTEAVAALAAVADRRRRHKLAVAYF